jgi:CubicO group peptidase (beta-lactamase class C family)
LKVDSPELRKDLEHALVHHRVPGASAAIFHEGKLIGAAAGVLNTNTGVELTPDTVMHIGSITKVINATLILQLVDVGKIDLDGRVLEYLPDLQLKDREALEQLTVRMLLNHTSGIDGDGLPDHGHDEETLEKGIGRMARLGQIHRPGAEYSYCNAASAIAGYLAQRRTGEAWYRLIRERIFAPLQMEHSVTLPEEALLHRAAVGHFLTAPPDRRVQRVSRVFLPFGLAPAGASLMLSAQDLVTFARMHLDEGLGPNGTRILSKQSALQMRQMTIDNRGKGYTFTDGLGLGWMICNDGLLHHSGGGPGIVSVLYAHPEKQFAAAVLTNAEFTLSWPFVSELIQSWLEEAGIVLPVGLSNVRVPAEPVSIDPLRFVGVYENSSSSFCVTSVNGQLKLATRMKRAIYEYTSLEPTPAAPLVPLGGDKFLLAGTSSSSAQAFSVFAFRNSDATGRMQHLGNGDRLHQRVDH